MRNLNEWRKAAKNEEDEHLLAFNYDRYMDGSLQATWVADGLPDAFERFNNHLAATDPSYVCPIAALEAFANEEVERLADNVAARTETAAFVGVEATGSSRFVALKSLHFLSDNMASVGLGDFIIGDLVNAVGRVVGSTRFKQRPLDQSYVDTKRKIDKVITAFINSPIVPAGEDTDLANRTGASGGNAISIQPVSFGSNPVWLTCEDSLPLSSAGEVPEQEYDVTIRSAYSAGMKEALGLWSEFEGGTDSQRFGRENIENTLRYGIVFLLAVNLEDRMPVQPSIFSLGTPELFVARPSEPNRHLNGRTVHLQRTACNPHDHSCGCGSPGLPEAVLPAEEVMRVGAKVMYHAFVFGEDLPFAYPDQKMIRSKNA